MTDNLIFLTDADLDRPVYRIFSFERLKEIFSENKLTLVKPKLWDDPFENFILKSTGVFPDGRHFDIHFRENYYGQCWSLTKESDAMWRIYSPKKDGLKVKTTIRKLFTPLFNLCDCNQNKGENIQRLSSFIGKVKYADTATLIEMLSDKERMSGKIFDQTGWGQASSFFFKRKEFKHENEIRLIYNFQNGNVSNFFKFSIDPLQLFEEIVFDPRITKTEYEIQKSVLISMGYNKKVIQSELYKIKTFTVLLNPIP